MPFAQYHYPFENEELFESQFPADFISEGIDQTRGWFYTMLVISTFLKGTSSYKRCLTIELILDKHGKKMSKSVGNTVDPMAIMRDKGADPLRWYMLTVSPCWTPTRFDVDGVAEAQRKLIATLENTYAFFSLYANLDGWTPGTGRDAAETMLDRWVLSRLHTVTAEVREAMEELDFTKAGRLLGAFVMDDVSNWYVRLARRRFWHGETTPDKEAAYATLHAVLTGTLRLLAPMVPFVTEEIWRALHADDDAASVHLQDYPETDAARIDAALEQTMRAAQDSVSVGRSLRQDSRLRTRQPLGRLLLHADDGRAAALHDDPHLRSILMEELNVKELALVDDPKSVARLAGKPNFRALGPRFGKQAPVAAKVISAMTADHVLELRRNGTVDLEFEGAPAPFTTEEVQVVEEGVAPYVAGSENGLTVALDTTLTPELVDEGLCREIINKVQNLRKKSGLEVQDRIRLAVSGDDDVARVLVVHGEHLAGETLAVLADPTEELEHADAFEVDGHEIRVSLARRDDA